MKNILASLFIILTLCASMDVDGVPDRGPPDGANGPSEPS